MNRLHPLVQRLVAESRAEAVSPETVADWAARPGTHVLFFSGDPVQFQEGPDVAVVLPELQAATGTRFDVGVVPRAHEDALARRYAVNHWPSLVFLRDGGHLGTVAGMRDWAEYVDAVRAALDAPVRRLPGVGIPVVAAAAAPSCH